MDFNRHYNLQGTHAFLAPSKPAWLSYDEEKLGRRYHADRAARRGTHMHKLAADLISLGVNLPDTPTTMNMYVNSAIGYRMSPEVVLRYSENCYGSADAIGFRENTLRVHDLKTGVSPSYFDQLETYAGIFCHEYDVNPFEIVIELRIFQNDNVKEVVCDPARIMSVMDRIKFADGVVKDIRKELGV